MISIYHIFSKMHGWTVCFKSLDEGFSTFSMVCACLNPPPCIKGVFSSPPQRSWFPNRVPGKLSHVRRISQGQVFSHSEGSRSRLPKIKIKIKSRKQTHTPGKNTCDRTLQICIKHAVFFSMVCARLNFFKIFIFYFFPPAVPERNP